MCHLSNVAQRLSHASFAVFTCATWSTKNEQHLRELLHEPICFFSWTSGVQKCFKNNLSKFNFWWQYFPKVVSHKSFSSKKIFIIIFHVWKLLSFNCSILWASKVDATIVSRTMLENKTPRSLKLLAKCQKNKNKLNISKLSKTIKNNFNLSFLQKQPCSNTMLEINNRSMRE
jgi:hypothetical protein